MSGQVTAGATRRTSANSWRRKQCADALAPLVARRFQTAIEWADRALNDQPRLATGHRVKAIANAYLGRLGEAHAALGRLLAISPQSTIADWRAFSAASVACEGSGTLRQRIAPSRLAGGVNGYIRMPPLLEHVSNHVLDASAAVPASP